MIKKYQYTDLCKIYGKEDIDKIVDFSKIHPNSPELHDFATRLLGRTGHYVLEQLSLISDL